MTKDYEGKWYLEDYKLEMSSKDKVFSGTEMTLEVSDDGNDGIMKLKCVSVPPQSRIVYIKADWTIKDDNTATFSFDDDGWGNNGTRIILFQKDKVTVKTNVNISDDSNWNIFIAKKYS